MRHPKGYNAIKCLKKSNLPKIKTFFLKKKAKCCRDINIITVATKKESSVFMHMLALQIVHNSTQLKSIHEQEILKFLDFGVKTIENL